MAHRSLLFLGLAFFACWLAGGALYGTGFPRSTSAAEVAAARDASEWRLAAGISFATLAWAFFLPFLGLLATVLRGRDAGDGAATTTAYGAGLLVAGLFLADHALNGIGLAARPPSAEDLRAWYAFGAGNALGVATALPRTVLLASVAWVLLAADAAAWLGWVSLGLAAVSAAGIAAAIAHPIVQTLAFAGFAAFPFWVLLVSVGLAAEAARARPGAGGVPRV